MDKLSINFNYDKRAKPATRKSCDVTTSDHLIEVNDSFVEYDLNKFSLESAFEFLCERLDFFTHLLKTPDNFNYGKD